MMDNGLKLPEDGDCEALHFQYTIIGIDRSQKLHLNMKIAFLPKACAWKPKVVSKANRKR